MNPKKGDLVLVSNGERTTTCIILTVKYHMSSGTNHDFYYSYCLDDGLYGLIYKRELVSIVSEGFAPDFPCSSDLFDTNYGFYSDFYEDYFYFPWSGFQPDDDSEE